MVGAKLI